MKIVKRNKITPWLLCLLSGLVLWLGWPPHRLPIFLLVGFVPLLYLEHYLSEHQYSKRSKFGYLYLAFLCFNIFTTWWVAYASFEGAIFMLLANSLVMLLPFWAYSITKSVIGLRKALIALIFYWLAFEYFHFRWDLAYPWLTLGNGFAATPSWVQWYEYTGSGGGTLWVIGFSGLLFYTLYSPSIIRYVSVLVLLIGPYTYSRLIPKLSSLDPHEIREVIVLQPNIDPYNEKFNGSNYEEQAMNFLNSVKDSIGTNTSLILFPETALVDHINEEGINHNPTIKILKNFVSEYPHLRILSGASTYRFYKDGEKKSATARKTSSGDYYETYNTALLIGPSGVENIYHKSKLVPGVEKMPYPEILGFLEKLSINMGGISGSLSGDKEAKIFFSDSFAYAPLICYESVFGNYVKDFVQKGSQALFVITNDGWWDETDGHRHHKDYARLRAIESRRDVVRCANTGISCHIDAWGNVLHETKWWEEDVFKVQIKIRQSATFYSKNGDGLGRLSLLIGILTFLSVLTRRFTKKKNLV